MSGYRMEQDVAGNRLEKVAKPSAGESRVRSAYGCPRARIMATFQC